MVSFDFTLENLCKGVIPAASTLRFLLLRYACFISIVQSLVLIDQGKCRFVLINVVIVSIARFFFVLQACFDYEHRIHKNIEFEWIFCMLDERVTQHSARCHLYNVLW